MTSYALIGLGNPGAQYERTRHNAGFWLVDALCRAHNVALKADKKFHGQYGSVVLGGTQWHFLKPDTFMNRSGIAVRALCDFYKLTQEQVLVAHDELDLAPGVVRLKKGGGHGGHNGLRDTTAHLGADYLRARIGIGHPGSKELVLGYVLGVATKEHEKLIQDGIIALMSAVERLGSDGLEKTVQALHS